MEQPPSKTSLQPFCTDIWYLAYTKPKQEAVAHFNLEQQGFNVYFPLYKKFKRTELGPTPIYDPMFPRYLFFRPNAAGQSLSPIHSTRGVTCLVRFGSQPATVADSLVQRIQLEEQARNAMTFQETNVLREGQQVQLKHTALGDIYGLVQSVSSKRVAVLLEILGRPAVVKVEHFQVEPVGT
jgi:transcriptional antiterminator RfaH